MKLVVDASVALKWFLQDAADEPNLFEALNILKGVKTGEHEIFQPPHWLAEVLSVLVRKRPHSTHAALMDLRSLSQELPTTDADYVRAMELSHRLNQHLFDALYHAVALERGAVLVTADERYHTAAAAEGAILRLSDFTIS